MMEHTLEPGMTFEYSYPITREQTVPALYPDIEEAAAMPKVFATGYMVGLMEFACIKFINNHIDWPRQQTVGIHIDVSHISATPPGMTVTVEGRLDEVDGRKLNFTLKASDDRELISEGTHKRFIIDADRFNAAVVKKQAGIA